MTSEEIKETQEAAPVHRLSGGDAGVIVGLLAFILIWIGGCVWGFVATADAAVYDAAVYEDIKWWTAVIIIAIVAGPPLWASNMIKDIIDKS